jgi:hypothetical protein
MFEYSTLENNYTTVCRPKNTTEDTMWSPEFNNAAIVEYTAAIPEAKAKPAVALPSYILFHKLISVRGYKYFYLLFSK